MIKLFLSIMVMGLFVSPLFAQDRVMEDCSDKDNYLQGMIKDFYHYVHFQALEDIELSDEHNTVVIKAGQKIKILDTNIEDDKMLVFDIADLATGEILPKLIYKAADPYEATILDIEKEQPFEVSCSVILPEDHYSQYGRWYYEFKLRKRKN